MGGPTSNLRLGTSISSRDVERVFKNNNTGKIQTMTTETEWHLSKSVPLTFVVAIFLQTVSLVWYVSSMDNNIKNNQKEILRQEIRLSGIEDTVQTQALTLARIDENIKSIRVMLERVSNKGDPR